MNKHIGLGWYIFLILFTPLAACGLVYSVRTMAEYPKPLLWLGVGFAAYFLLQQYFKNRKMRRGDYTVDEFTSTFSHEFTHTVVSWLMLKKVSSFKATSQHGGENVILPKIQTTDMRKKISNFAIRKWLKRCKENSRQNLRRKWRLLPSVIR